MKKLIGLAAFAALVACKTELQETAVQEEEKATLSLEAEDFVKSSGEVQVKDGAVTLSEGDWLQLELPVATTGRYRIWLYGKSGGGTVWMEDHVENPDDRTYDISGKLKFEEGTASVTGSPLAEGQHLVKVHIAEGEVQLDRIEFELMHGFSPTKPVLEQNMEGEEWELVWSDEFNGEGLPDTTKWTYNVGNWGWGNNELQFYTDHRLKNARQENGSLIIEAHKNDSIYPWSSARLTTQGKQSFLYGRMEFRAKVPPGRGAWAAGWLLGEAYRDELSWPYCGEIDVLECVGYEIDDVTGQGKNHATCHTRAYYFKQGNQIGNEIVVGSMFQKFHTYAIEWYPDRVDAYLDGEYYFTYDKNQDELEWPFFRPQNIILNIAVGGGWGGAQGVDPAWDKHRYELDYVRVYQKKKS